MTDETQAPTPSLAPETSPLAEVDPNSIDEFIEKRVGDTFNKSPLTVTDDDLSIAVRFYRLQRQRFAIESKGTKPVTAKPRKKPNSIAEALDLSALDGE